MSTTIRVPDWRFVKDGEVKRVNTQLSPEPDFPAPDWSEEFNSLDLTTSSHTGLWRPNDFWQNINGGYEDFAGTSYNANPNETSVDINPFSVADSVLTITCIRTPANKVEAIRSSMSSQGQGTNVPNWVGGILITDPNTKYFKYGYFETKARFPVLGKGMFPAIWLFRAPSGEEVAGKESAELDIFEIFGYGSGNPVSISVHGSLQSTIHNYNVDVTQWHRYAMDWQPTYIRFYLDEVLLIELTGTDASWFNTTMGMRLNYSMDAPWFGAQTSDGSTPSTLTMQVDYVRQWNTNPY